MQELYYIKYLKVKYEATGFSISISYCLDFIFELGNILWVFDVSRVSEVDDGQSGCASLTGLLPKASLRERPSINLKVPSLFY